MMTQLSFFCYDEKTKNVCTDPENNRPEKIKKNMNIDSKALQNVLSLFEKAEKRRLMDDEFVNNDYLIVSDANRKVYSFVKKTYNREKQLLYAFYKNPAELPMTGDKINTETELEEWKNKSEKADNDFKNGPRRGGRRKSKRTKRTKKRNTRRKGTRRRR